MMKTNDDFDMFDENEHIGQGRSKKQLESDAKVAMWSFVMGLVFIIYCLGYAFVKLFI